MKFLRRAVLPIAAGIAAPALALSVALPQAPGFRIGNQHAAGRAVLVEMVPTSETVQRFTKMITLRTAPGAGSIPSATYVAEFAKRYMATCPGSTAVPVP